MSSSVGFDSNKDYYAALSVTRDVDNAGLKTVFFRLAKELHPDKTSGDLQKAERFKEVREAYEVLIDWDLRQQYNKARPIFANSATESGPATPPPTPPPRSQATPPRPSGKSRASPATYTTPAADCIFSDYFFGNHRWKAFFNMVHDAYDEDIRAWEQSVREANNARDRAHQFAGTAHSAIYERGWNRKLSQCDKLRLNKETAQAILEQHKERAAFLMDQKVAEVRVKRAADAAKKRAERQKKNRARKST